MAKTTKYSGFCSQCCTQLQNASLIISLSGMLHLTALKFWRKCLPAYACRCSQKTKHIVFLESLSHCVALAISVKVFVVWNSPSTWVISEVFRKQSKLFSSNSQFAYIIVVEEVGFLFVFSWKIHPYAKNSHEKSAWTLE